MGQPTTPYWKPNGSETVLEKPEWLKIRPPTTEHFSEIRGIVRQHGLATVCQEAHCPNMAECWSGGTATFMVMGDTCTRACKFCAIKTAFPAPPLDPKEPEKLASAISKMKLDYAVITSVDRDDLKDQGASHFAACIAELRKQAPGLLVEVLIPDFRGKDELIQAIADAKPDVIAHNIETVRSLQGKVRDPRANYEQSLHVLDFAKKADPGIYTKSSIMLGLGEKDEEVIEAMRDLRAIGVSIVTFGQYLRPSLWHVPVAEYVTPEKFGHFRKAGEEMGFAYVASGPFVRSSYRAGELFMKNVLKKQKA
jgi:lipoic acid synthetase